MDPVASITGTDPKYNNQHRNACIIMLPVNGILLEIYNVC
jgi:hypothetical protein